MRGAVAWRCVQVGSLAMAAAVGGWWGAHVGAAAGGLAALAVLLAPAWLLACQSAWSARLNREDVLTWRQRGRAWAVEWWWNQRVFGWQQPWRADACPDTVAPLDRRGVLLVHGHLCTRAFWLPWLRRLQAAGVPFATVELWPPWQDIDATAPAIDAALRRLTALTGRAPVVLAHSKGGLNVRAWRRWAAQRGETAPERRVHALITAGTPHRGTLLALSALGRSARQMQPGAPWLQALAASEPPGWRRRIGCVASAADAVVYPTSLATLDGAATRKVTDAPHIELAFGPAVAGWLWAALDGPDDGLPW
jgi:hypothetical protein